MKNFPLFPQKYHFHLRNFIKNAILLFYFPQKNLPTPALFFRLEMDRSFFIPLQYSAARHLS